MGSEMCIRDRCLFGVNEAEVKKKIIRYYIVLERAQGSTLLDCNYADTCFTVALGSVLAGCYTQVPHRSTLYRHGPPLFAPPSTSARAQSRFEFVEIGRGMFFNYQGEVQAITRIIGCSHLVPRAIYESTVYMYENIEYVQVPEDPLCNTCLLYTSPSPRDLSTSRMPSSA